MTFSYSRYQLIFTLFLGASFSFTCAQAQSNFVPVTPCRIADTRNANGPFGGPSLQGGTTRSFAIPASPCGIPGSATAYAFNVTVVPHRPVTYLVVWPTGQPMPVASTLNAPAGQISCNAALVAAGTNGAVNVYTSDTTDVVLDIEGYFVAQPQDAFAGLNFSDGEVPAGTVNGQNTLFTLAFTPMADPVLTNNGVVVKQGADYTLNGTVITFSPSATPQPGDLLQAWYRYFQPIAVPGARRSSSKTHSPKQRTRTSSR